MAIGVQITFDAHDTAGQAAFWALALDYVLQPPPPGFDSWEAFAEQVGIPRDQWDRLNAVIDPEGVGPRVLFQKVPEDKTVKNRVHLDVNVGGLAENRRELAQAHREKLEAAGARFVREVDEPSGWCLVMTDPEGNEFCLQ
ncbi:VOC family protein [Actinomycetospora lutea]|uniref:VOC family protein n=1 Tax=Actinomycetospora lutea TaxID=663604 RepID=UPI0023652E15|nr:VOC family protein [Actinomycetospora lutea]MDD7937260.1 VOC family protein [Actinomycetospora lutea]